MLDIGWGELLLIGVVALIVVGPKELPALFRTVGNFMGRARGMAREFQRSMEQAADESGLKDAARDLQAVDKLRLNSASNAARDYATKLVKGIDESAAAADAPQAAAATPTAAQATTATAAKVATQGAKPATKPAAEAAVAGARPPSAP